MANPVVTNPTGPGPASTGGSNVVEVLYDRSTGIMTAGGTVIPTASTANITVSGAPLGGYTAALLGDSVMGYTMLPTVPAAASFTASITSNVMTVSTVASGLLMVQGQVSGGNITGTPTILNQLTGNNGSTGTYTVSNTPNAASSAGCACSAAAGDGTTTRVSSPFNPVLDGALLNISAAGAPFDQKQVVATSINVHGFSFPSSLLGVSPAITSIYNPFVYSERGWINWMNMIGGQKFRITNFACFGGNTAVQALARIAQVTQATPKPSYCFVMLGVNDAAGGATPSAIASTLITIYQTLQAAGITPIAQTILPLHSSFSSGVGFTATTATILAVNNLIKNYCAINNILCIDAFTAMVDTSATNGQGVATYYNTSASDFIHPVTQAARLIGAAWNTSVASLPAPSILTVNGADNFGTSNTNPNILDFAPWTTSGGSVNGTGSSGTLPTGFSLTLPSGTGTCVCSVPARTVIADGDTIGNNCQLVITSSGTPQYTLTMADVTSRAVVGGTYSFRCTIRLSGTSGSKMYKIQNTWLINDASSIRTGFTGALSSDATLQTDVQWADGTYTLSSPPFTYPVWGNNGFQPALLFFFAATGSAITINVGRCTIMRLS